VHLVVFIELISLAQRLHIERTKRWQ